MDLIYSPRAAGKTTKLIQFYFDPSRDRWKDVVLLVCREVEKQRIIRDFNITEKQMQQRIMPWEQYERHGAGLDHKVIIMDNLDMFVHEKLKTGRPLVQATYTGTAQPISSFKIDRPIWRLNDN